MSLFGCSYVEFDVFTDLQAEVEKEAWNMEHLHILPTVQGDNAFQS